MVASGREGVQSPSINYSILSASIIVTVSASIIVTVVRNALAHLYIMALDYRLRLDCCMIPNTYLPLHMQEITLLSSECSLDANVGWSCLLQEVL